MEPIVSPSELPLWMLLAVGAFVFIVLVAGVIGFAFLRKRKIPKLIDYGTISREIQSPIAQVVNRCPVCNSTYTDLSLKYCLADGTLLERPDDVETETVIRRL